MRPHLVGLSSWWPQVEKEALIAALRAAAGGHETGPGDTTAAAEEALAEARRTAAQRWVCEGKSKGRHWWWSSGWWLY